MPKELYFNLYLFRNIKSIGNKILTFVFLPLKISYTGFFLSASLFVKTIFSANSANFFYVNCFKLLTIFNLNYK